MPILIFLPEPRANDARRSERRRAKREGVGTRHGDRATAGAAVGAEPLLLIGERGTTPNPPPTLPELAVAPLVAVLLLWADSRAQDLRGSRSSLPGEPPPLATVP